MASNKQANIHSLSPVLIRMTVLPLLRSEKEEDRQAVLVKTVDALELHRAYRHDSFDVFLLWSQRNREVTSVHLPHNRFFVALVHNCLGLTGRIQFAVVTKSWAGSETTGVEVEEEDLEHCCLSGGEAP